jgi:hypothetical protein
MRDESEETMGQVNENGAKHLGTAWACKDCGHILNRSSDDAPSGKCPECHANPAHWLAAEITDEPVDADVPAVADYARDQVDSNDPTGPFATSPAGKEGEDINPELRVRF